MLSFEGLFGIIAGFTIITFVVVIGLISILGVPLLLFYELFKWSAS